MNSNNAKETTNTALAITHQMQTVLDFIEENGQITDSEVQELLEIKNTRSYTLMKQMEKDGLIVIVGRGSSKKYLKKIEQFIGKSLLKLSVFAVLCMSNSLSAFDRYNLIIPTRTI